MADLNIPVLIALAIYFVGVFLVGIYSMRYVSKARTSSSGDGFFDEYFTSSRDLGGFVLAMTMVTTYLSAGSFIGGPGTAYTFGLGWTFLAMTQMPTGYFALSVLGKKFAIIARKIRAVTITDFIRARYESKALVIIVSLSIIFFFIAAMAAQWIGAARLLEGSVGLPYITALSIFAITVIIYTTIGGFRAVALTDTLQGVVMTIGTIVLFIFAVRAGGGVENIITSMRQVDPGLITPFGVQEGFMTKAWVTSFWILVGFAIVGLPSIAVRAMSYKDSRSLHRGIKYGTLISMILLLLMHLVGTFGSVLVTGIESGDLVVPTLAVNLFPGWLAGLILAGPLAAVMSTVDSQLLIVVGAMVNDLYANYIRPEIKEDNKKMSRVSLIATLIIGAIIFLVAARPPDLMVWLNLYANAGLISTFLWPVILGLYWKKANKQGAFSSMITGIGSYILFSYAWPRPLGTHTIVLPLVISFFSFVIVAHLTEDPPQEIIETFWGI